MKHLALVTIASLALSSAALAENHSHAADHGGVHLDKMKDKSAYSHASDKVVKAGMVKEQKSVDYTAKESIGIDVLNKKGEKLGTISDMGISESGTVSYVMIDVDGDEVGVPYNKLSWNKDKQAVSLDMSKEALKAKI